MPYDIGDAIRLQATFRDASSNLVDPTTVTIGYRTPAGVLTEYIYGVSQQVEHPSAGVYFVVLIPSMEGLYWYRYSSTGTYASAEERAFYVNPKKA